MCKLTDLELCKKIADIEGIEVWGATDMGKISAEDRSYLTLTDPAYAITSHEYNPLTDKNLLIELMLKFKILACGSEVSAKVLNGVKVERAILECIVEANNV